MPPAKIPGQLDLLDAIPSQYNPYSWPHASLFEITCHITRECTRAWEAHFIAVEHFYQVTPGGSAITPEQVQANLASRETGQRYVYWKNRYDALRHFGKNLRGMNDFYAPIYEELGLTDQHRAAQERITAPQWKSSSSSSSSYPYS